MSLLYTHAVHIKQTKPIFASISLKMKSNHRSSESDSSSEDENLAHLREAADTSFISDSMFKLAGQQPQESSSKCSVTTILIVARKLIFLNTEPAAILKSQRHVTEDNEHIDDLLIPEEVQVSKKLAKIIENRVEFVDVHGNDESEHRTDNTVEQIKLLGNVVLNIDWTDGETANCKRKKQEIKKRKLPDVDDTKTDSDRIRESVIGLEDVSKEVGNWKSRSKGVVYEYREKNGKLFEVEPTTEFSALRKRNNWTENRISRNKSLSK